MMCSCRIFISSRSLPAWRVSGLAGKGKGAASGAPQGSWRTEAKGREEGREGGRELQEFFATELTLLLRDRSTST